MINQVLKDAAGMHGNTKVVIKVGGHYYENTLSGLRKTYDGIGMNEYQRLSRGTALPNIDGDIFYMALKLAGESGEVAEAVGKMIRDNEGNLDDEWRNRILAEAGDVLWYIAQIVRICGEELGDVAQGNLDKLYSRYDRGVIHGDGDTR